MSVYYRDESLTFYPFPTLTKGQVSSFSSSQQDTDQYGAKLTLNSQPLAGGISRVSTPIMRPLMPTKCSSICHNRWPPAGCTTNRSHNRPLPGIQYFQCRAIPAVQLRSERYLYRQRRVRYQWTENRVDDFVGYAQQQDIANGKARSADAIKGGKTDYDNFLFNAGIVVHLTERQQTV